MDMLENGVAGMKLVSGVEKVVWFVQMYVDVNSIGLKCVLSIEYVCFHFWFVDRSVVEEHVGRILLAIHVVREVGYVQ